MRGIVRTILMAVTAASLSISLLPAPSAVAAELDERQVREIVEKLLRERPEIIVEALTAYQQQQELAKQASQREALSLQKAELFDKPGDPIMGDPNAPITIVEFFDYRCGYCKRVLNDVMAVAKNNPDVKVVFKEFPILGDASVLASRVALAVHLVAPQKYGEFHKRLMGSRGSYNETSLLQLADALGIDSAEVRSRMSNPAVVEAIRANYQLAEQLGINGTPAFVVGDEIVPGAISRSALEQLVQRQRG